RQLLGWLRFLDAARIRRTISRGSRRLSEAGAAVSERDYLAGGSRPAQCAAGRKRSGHSTFTNVVATHADGCAEPGARGSAGWTSRRSASRTSDARAELPRRAGVCVLRRRGLCDFRRRNERREVAAKVDGVTRVCHRLFARGSGFFEASV